MTRSAVAEKLFRLMNRPPEDERDIVYALTKIRKLLEFDGAKKRHRLLTVFCDWVLHNQLDRLGAQAVLQKLDQLLVQHGPFSPENNVAQREVFDFVSLDLFRKDLRVFLQENKMPTVWVDDMFAWQTTISLYGEEVLGTPLVMERKARKSQYLTKAVIEACEPAEDIAQANPHMKLFGFKWIFALSDGQTIHLPHTFNLAVPPEGWITQGARRED